MITRSYFFFHDYEILFIFHILPFSFFLFVRQLHVILFFCSNEHLTLVDHLIFSSKMSCSHFNSHSKSSTMSHFCHTQKEKSNFWNHENILILTEKQKDQNLHTKKTTIFNNPKNSSNSLTAKKKNFMHSQSVSQKTKNKFNRDKKKKKKFTHQKNQKITGKTKNF